MTELHEKLAEVRDGLKPDWSEEDTERALANVPKRRAQRKRHKQIGAAVALVALAGAAGLVAVNLVPPGGGSAPPVPAEQMAELPPGLVGQPTSGAFALYPGSSVTPGADSIVTLVEKSGSASRVELKKGSATFAIAAADRRVYVLAGKVQFEAAGTTFEVRKSSEYVEVFVVNGSVTVTVNGEEVTLQSGAREQFPLEDSDVGAVPIVFAPDSVAEAIEVAEAELDAKPEAPAAAGSAEATAVVKRSGEKWERLAQERDWKAAASALAGSQPATIEQLFLAADVQRYAGHPLKAVPYLDKVVSEHRGDSRAAMAQFQKGRILMNVGEHADAAAAFASVRAMPANGAVAEDALSREVEAWYRAGDRDKARRSAESYLEAHPDGYRAKVVRRYGGITSP